MPGLLTVIPSTDPFAVMHDTPHHDLSSGRPISAKELARRIRVAQGKETGELLLTGGQVVNVFTRRIEPANVVIADGWIAGVGAYDWPARQTLNISDKFVTPGFIDSHMHLESTLLTPAELARLIVPHGTTAIISDSHEIGNVLGIAGIDMLLGASAGLPLDLFFTASSCVPDAHWEHTGAVLGAAEVNQLLSRPRMLGLAEVMDVPALLNGEPDLLAKLQAALSHHRVLDGHAPGMMGRELQACVASGIRSDHESSTVAEARAKAALGMLVQVREGSSAHNLDTLLPLLAAGELADGWCLVTDDIFPDDLREHGHVDGLLRRVVAAGVPAATAVRHASLVPARHYGLHDRGAVTPGYRADLVVVDDLRALRPELVLKSGHVVARAGKFTADLHPPRLIGGNTIHLAPLGEAAFRLPLSKALCPVIGVIPGQIMTRLETREVGRSDGHWTFDPKLDVALVASLERHKGTGHIGLGLVSGFGFRREGALASSVAHDAHNLIVAGTNARDMLACIRWLEERGGGFVVAADGAIQAQLPLPIAGLLSTKDGDSVCRELHEVYGAARALGCTLASPFGTLSFLALPVIPELRITDQGLFDVVKQQFIHGIQS
jgi:adenine deaminase